MQKMSEMNKGAKRGFKHRFRKNFSRCRQEDVSSLNILKIAVVGSPNVGKSMLFNTLTKKYVAVSNYPGTTVEVTRGLTRIEGIEYQIIDTPGMYSFSPITDEERVARRILIREKPFLVIHVVDARNLERMLPLTLQLIEASLSTMLVLNIMDEAEKEGIFIDVNLLSKKLNIPAIETIAINSKGINELKTRIAEYGKRL